MSATVLNGDGEVDCDVIVCSDDDRARQVASELATKIPGVRAIDGGKLENARIVEVDDGAADHAEHPAQSAWSRVEGDGAGNLEAVASGKGLVVRKNRAT